MRFARLAESSECSVTFSLVSSATAWLRRGNGPTTSNTKTVIRRTLSLLSECPSSLWRRGSSNRLEDGLGTCFELVPEKLELPVQLIRLASMVLELLDQLFVATS